MMVAIIRITRIHAMITITVVKATFSLSEKRRFFFICHVMQSKMISQAVVNSDPDVMKQFMLNSAEHEILNVHNHQKYKEILLFFLSQISLDCYFFLLKNV